MIVNAKNGPPGISRRAVFISSSVSGNSYRTVTSWAAGASVPAWAWAPKATSSPSSASSVSPSRRGRRVEGVVRRVMVDEDMAKGNKIAASNQSCLINGHRANETGHWRVGVGERGLVVGHTKCGRALVLAAARPGGGAVPPV